MSMGIQRFDRTAALHDGRVRAPGVQVSHVLPAVGVHGLLSGAFDAAEIPLAHYVLLRGLGEPFTALPVFPDRIFVQQYAYTSPESGIQSPADLRGRRVGVPMYFMTSSIWHRGFLHEDTGITPEEIQWVTTSAERDARVQPPRSVPVTHVPGSHLGLELLTDGTVDALLTEGTPLMNYEERRRVVPLYGDPGVTQSEFFRLRQMHPIVHVIALRSEAMERRPDLFEVLCEAFDRALWSCYQLLQNERMVGLPLMRAYLDQTEELFGDDPWPYGLDGRNADELTTFLRFAHEQGLTDRHLELEDVFDRPAFAYQFRARMPRGADLGSQRSLIGVGPATS